MNRRVTRFIAATAFVSIVAVPLAVRAQEQAPSGQPGQAAQAPQTATASGELVSVDVKAKTLAVKADGRDMQFTFTETTKITGASSPAGLATMGGSQVTVRYTAADRVATEIQISPKK